MSKVIKSNDRPVILVGGGDINWPVLQDYLDRGYPVIAADGATNLLIKNNILPDLIIGDLDSIGDQMNFPQSTTVIKIDEQNSTDFEKCLYSIAAPAFVGFGFLGKRFDHSLAALHILAKYCSEKTIRLIDMLDTVFVTRGTVNLALPIGSRVSVFPLGKVTFEMSSGLEYPLDGLTMEIGQASGTSNKSTEAQVQIRPSANTEAPYAVIVSSENHAFEMKS
ncbi:MAG: thiamine diphosphokinase [Alphaproteobacteria bacterium]|jgi:thiamine pyrophosphokinase|nr:thiamine diphosphokinase [Alphaproteobacteria bacterium]MBT4019349.1 thiamine diphosphokinase [Alphaproteobacteria bacterium]MBT4966684.1 thiamine diphosphokinase [Alphaproteobacteria bacterium]MBT5161951.1 thiamine diphosphokinase [Alphaproteobacteria bacterium]MBT5917178.1 thiamine diphosphokinase [Alphaproteobacteria bacterium]